MTPRISVVVPTYNRDAVLSRTLASVLAQSCPPHEVIVVDDGSTDDTAKVVAVHRDSHSRIYYIAQRNGGPAAARNAGIAAASGDWIAFLDSDDWWSPRKLEHAIEEMRRSPAVEFIHANKCYVFQDGNDDGRAPFKADDLVDRKYLLCHWAIKTSTVLIRRSLLSRLDYHFPVELQSAEDYELFWRAVIEARKIGYAPQCDTTIVMTQGSIIRSGRQIGGITDNLEACSRAARWLLKKKHDPQYVAILRQFQYWQLRTLLALRFKQLSLLAAMRAWLRWRSDVNTIKAIRALLSACRGQY